MDEEELPILTKTVATDTDPNKTEDGLPILKKKDVSGSKSVTGNASSTPAKPSKTSTEKSTDTSKELNFVAAIKDMFSGYDKPADKKDEAPAPFINAVKRGLNLAKQADIIGPFADAPDAKGLEEVSKLQKETQNLPGSKEYKAFSSSKTFGEAASSFAKNPVKILAELTGESLSSLAKYGAPRIGAGALLGAGLGSVAPGVGTGAGAAGGAVVGLADTSLGLEYSSSFLESLKDAGIDVTDPKSLTAAFQDDKIISEARSHALKKGIPIAIFDLISGGIAGKLVAKPAKSILGKIASGALELGTQSALGAGGELAGEVISGEEIQPGAIVAEAVGELGTSPVEIGAGALTFNKKDVINNVRENVDTTNPASVDAAAEKIEKVIAPPVVEEATVDTGSVSDADASVSLQDVIDERDGIQTNNKQEFQEADQNGETFVEDNSTTEGVQAEDTQAESAPQGEAKPEEILSEQSEQPVSLSEQKKINSTPNDAEQNSTPKQQEPQQDVVVEQSNGKQELPDKTQSSNKSIGERSANSKEVASTGSIALDSPDGEKLSGIKKALVSEDKIKSTAIEKRSTEEMLTSAKDQVDSGELNPKAIVDEISQGNSRALQPDEVAGLVYYKTQLDNKSDQLNSDLLSAMESGDTNAQASLKSQINGLNKEIDNYHTMSVKTAYEQSLAFRLRQMLLDNEYNVQSQINKYKVVNNGQISVEVEQKFKELDSKLKDANAKIRKLEEIKLNKKSEDSIQSIRQHLQRSREIRLKNAQAKKDRINDFFNSKKLKYDPNKLNSISQVIGETVFNAALEVVRVSLLAGNEVATAIQAGVDYINEHYRGDDFDDAGFRAMLQPDLEQILPSESEIGNVEIRDGKLRIPSSLIKSLVESGVDNINELVDKLYDQIKSELPSVSKRDIRDSITKYGETRNLSKDEIDVKIREMKRIGRMVSSLEDIQNRKRPLRSGLQRDKLTDQERRMQRDIKEGIKNLPIDQDEIDKAWRNALDTVKSRLKNQITDLENQIKTGEKSPKKEGIKYDQEASELKDQRDKLRAVIESIEGKPKLSDEQRVRMAISAVEKSIVDLEQRISNKDTSKKQSYATPETPLLKSLRDRRNKLSADYKQMEIELGVAEKRKLDTVKKAIKKATEKYEARIKNQDFVNKKKLPIPDDDEAIKLKLERDKIKQQFDIEQEKARLKNRPLSKKIWDNFIDIANLPKSLLASIDMSAPFRQGALLSVSNPSSGARSFGEMFRQAFSEQKANEWLLKLKESPEYALFKQSKLYLAEPTSKLTAKEEQFISNIAGKIPLFGTLVKGSERAYSAYLNKLRVDVFTNGVDRLMEQGKTIDNSPNEYKAWANFINNATGRGNLGSVENAAPLLNALFFSPRYVVSRLNILNPATYAKMPPLVRQMALKNVITYIGFTALFISLLDAAFDDLDIEWDPRSSDFGKIRIGNTRFDFWAGFQQPVRLIAQIVSGQRKSTKTGAITDLSADKFPYETRGDVAFRFLRSKLSPTAGTVVNLATEKNLVGEDVTLKDEVIKNVIPLYIQDINGIYKEEGPTGLITTTVPAFFGVGVQNYGEKSGLSNQSIDEDSKIKNLNKERKYSISTPSKSDISESLDHEIDDDTFDKYNVLRDNEIKRLFDAFQERLKSEKDIEIYDKLMDQIVRESTRHAKYVLSKEKKWWEVADNFKPGDPFRMKGYKKNKEGKVVPR